MLSIFQNMFTNIKFFWWRYFFRKEEKEIIKDFNQSAVKRRVFLQKELNVASCGLVFEPFRV